MENVKENTTAEVVETEDKGANEFMQLMQEVATLPERKRNVVAIFSQGVLALDAAQKGI